MSRRDLGRISSFPQDRDIEGRLIMNPIADRLRRHIHGLQEYIDDMFGDAAPDVAATWAENLDPIVEHIDRESVGRGLIANLVEIDGDPNDEEADDERTAMRLEIRFRHIPNVTIYLTSEHYDGMPRLRIWTTVRRGVGLLDEEWDQLPIATALSRFIDKHNEAAAAIAS
jgi:hypothetical protein